MLERLPVHIAAQLSQHLLSGCLKQVEQPPYARFLEHLQEFVVSPFPIPERSDNSQIAVG
jgi:hypothetical protein